MKPITREEVFLNRVADSGGMELEPITREEHFLARAAGLDGKVLDPITRREHFLQAIIDGGGPGPTPSGTISISQNGTYDVAAYAEAEVSVPKGKEIVLLASGSYTLAAQAVTMTIPVEYSGTVLYTLIEVEEFIPDVAQTAAWQESFNVPREEGADSKGFGSYGVSRPRLATNQYASSYSPTYTTLSQTSLRVSQASSNYPIRANTYKWEIWGYAE